MSIVTRKVKGRDPDNEYYCLACGQDDERRDKLEVIQVGGGWVARAHGHCRADIDIEFALKSLEKAREHLNKLKFDARKALKCLERANRDIVSAKDCLIGKSLWPNLC
jgi:hypothetical protein